MLEFAIYLGATERGNTRKTLVETINSVGLLKRLKRSCANTQCQCIFI